MLNSARGASESRQSRGRSRILRHALHHIPTPPTGLAKGWLAAWAGMTLPGQFTQRFPEPLAAHELTQANGKCPNQASGCVSHGMGAHVWWRCRAQTARNARPRRCVPHETPYRILEFAKGPSMKHIRRCVAGLWFAGATSLLAPGASAEPPGRLQGMFYAEFPLGRLVQGRPAPSYGFMLSSSSSANPGRAMNTPSFPIADFRFSGRQQRLDVLWLGTPQHRNNETGNADAEKAGGINWWVVGPVIGIAAAAIARDNRSKPQKSCFEPGRIDPLCP